MTDTTDQQAVTVAQQHDWLDAWLIRDGFGYTQPADDMRAAIRYRLASVSSANADDVDRANGVGQDELVAGIKRALQHPAGDHDGWTDAGMEHAFFRWPVIVNALNEALSSRSSALDEACNEDGSTDLHRDTPEPVPATNQAGEVALRVAAQKVVDAAPVNGNDRPHPAEYWAGIIALRAALATQPATSQEGETLDIACERSWDATHRTLWRHTSEEQRAEWAVGIRAALAATPTPLTLSEDLREFVAALERQMEDQDESLPSSLARERGLVWLEGWFDLRAALAQGQA